MRYWSYIFREWVSFAGYVLIMFGGLAGLVFTLGLILKHFA